MALWDKMAGPAVLISIHVCLLTALGSGFNYILFRCGGCKGIVSILEQLLLLT